MSDCVFCRIVARQIPATVVHEDEHVLAFMDLGQVNPGHVLVTIKAHAENLYALSDVQAGAVLVFQGEKLPLMFESLPPGLTLIQVTPSCIV